MSKQWGHGFNAGKIKGKEEGEANSFWEHSKLSWVAHSICEDISGTILDGWQDYTPEFQNLRYKILALEQVYLSLRRSVAERKKQENPQPNPHRKVIV